ILARRRLASGEMDLQHTDFGKFSEDLLPLLGGELAAAAIQLHRVGAIGALQRTAMGEFGEHRQRNAEGFRRRAARFQHRQAIGGIVCGDASVGEGRAHDVFSRASVRNPLSARSCSIAMTSVAIAPRSAAYFSASVSIMAVTLRTPSQRWRTSTPISSGDSTRSGARMPQTC